MTHVSRQILHPKNYKKIRTSFINALFARSPITGKQVLAELLTKTEKMMLAKRLAIIALLELDNSSYKISKILKVSDSTVMRFHRGMIAGNYPRIQAMARKPKDRLLTELFELLLGAGMPGIGGPKHTARLRRLRNRV